MSGYVVGALNLLDHQPVPFRYQAIAHGFLASLLEVEMAGLGQQVEAEEHT
jgi:hypothetical protein